MDRIRDQILCWTLGHGWMLPSRPVHKFLGAEEVLHRTPLPSRWAGADAPAPSWASLQRVLLLGAGSPAGTRGRTSPRSDAAQGGQELAGGEGSGDVTPCQRERSLQPGRGMRYLASESGPQLRALQCLPLAYSSRCCLSSGVHPLRPFLFDS